MEPIQPKGMSQTEKEKIPGYLNVVCTKCPRCRRGDMFVEKKPYKLRTTMKMNKECPVCGQPFELETGFYFGSGYVSYALCVAISVTTLIAWWVIIGLSVNDNRWLFWLATNGVILILLQPILMRVSRSVWLSFFVRYDRWWYENEPVALRKD